MACRSGVGVLLMCVVGCSQAMIPGGSQIETFGDPTTGPSSATGDETGEETTNDPSGSDGVESGDATCGDGALNGDETDIDCGGSCDPCGPGQGCIAADDCTSQLCVNQVCDGGGGCTNGAIDGDETDVDCGGSCQQCGTGDTCVDASDCESDVCVDQICTPPNCGDGMVQDDEECDDGGLTATCTAFCTFPVCGDGFVQNDEQCDDRGDSSTCDADCTTASCGDGTSNAAAGEDCDTGATETSTCDSDCTAADCGDGTLNASAGEACDDGAASATCDDDCTAATCGDSTVNGAAGEACDSAGESASCDADCSSVSCGDGNVNEAAGEECDGEALCDGCLWLGCAPDPQALALSACMAAYPYCEVVNGGVVGYGDGYCTGCNCGTVNDPWRFYCTVTSDASNYNCSACTVGEILAAHDPCNCDPGTSALVDYFCMN